MRMLTLTNRVRRVRTEQRGDTGFSLIEAVVSMTIFAIVSTAAVTAVLTGITSTHLTTTRVTASNIAQQDIQSARAEAPAQVSAVGYPRTVTQGITTYTVSRQVSFSPAGSSGCPSAGTAGGPFYVNVTDTVTWTGQHSPVRVDAVIAC
jgi:prepilin-type N-terminal cleavage/methylation domain-containing protein